MPTERLIAILEEIRDQQRLQIANYERALRAQEEAMAIQRHGKKLLTYMVAIPWLLVLAMGLLLALTVARS